MKRLALILLVTLGLSGCIAPKSFLEPKYRGVSYQDIKVPAAPQGVTLMVSGERNGSFNARVTEYWRRQVVRVLNASRVFDPSRPTADARLSVTINNVADLGTAAGKGFMTGLTFGAVGSLVTDGYIMSVDYHDAAGRKLTKTYQHAIYTTIGNASAPKDISPVSPAEAGSLVAEDMLLHFLKDLQSATSPP